jgi:hypothetical protein
MRAIGMARFRHNPVVRIIAPAARPTCGDRRRRGLEFAQGVLAQEPVEWLRPGLDGQRTRTVDSDRCVQRGPSNRITAGKATDRAARFRPGGRQPLRHRVDRGAVPAG